MRETSLQIYQKLIIQKTIDNLSVGEKTDFLWCIKQLKSMNRNELHAHNRLKIYASKYPELKNYIQDIFNEIEKKVLEHLEITKDGFKTKIKELEKMEEEI